MLLSHVRLLSPSMPTSLMKMLLVVAAWARFAVVTTTSYFTIVALRRGESLGEDKGLAAWSEVSIWYGTHADTITRTPYLADTPQKTAGCSPGISFYIYTAGFLGVSLINVKLLIHAENEVQRSLRGWTEQKALKCRKMQQSVKRVRKTNSE